MKTTTTQNRWWESLKFILLTILFGASVLVTHAQLPNLYSFTSTTASYTPITGGSVLGVATNDDASFTALPIGFTFNYNNNAYTTVSVNSNGFLAFGGAVASSYTAISTGGSNNVAAAFNNDLQGLATVGNLRYETIGTSPNQVFVAQWTNYKMYGAANNLDSFDFQIRLNEGTNVVQFVYGRITKNPTNTAVQVGLRGSSAAVFNNRTSATSWTATTAGAINSSTVALTTSITPPVGLTFTYTPPVAAVPTVSTGNYTNVTTSQVTLGGVVGAQNFPVVTASGILVSTSPSPIVGGTGVIDSTTNPVVTSGAFSKTITGLSNGTTYYYRAYATNSLGTSYGADSTFTTNASSTVPTVLSIAATNVQAYSGSVGGNITLDGGSAVTASGVVFSTTPNPALFGTGVIDSATNPLVLSGAYSFNLVGLIPSTKYYFRAYATNSVGTAYSILDSFTTAPVITLLPYNENFDLPGNTGWTSVALNAGTNAWQLGTPAKTNLSGAFSGTNAWVTRLTGDYLGTEDCAVLSPQMDFSSMTATPILRFKHEMDVDNDLGYDGGVVEISINGGVWTRLDAVTGTAPLFNTTNSVAWYNNTGFGPLGSPLFSANTATSYPGNVNGWVTSSTPLTGAAGQSNVRIRFRFAADIFTDEGWALDNIEIFAPSAPTVLTGAKTNVTTSNATLAGSITNNGGNAVTFSGIVISTSPSPTRGSVGVIDSATNPLVTSGMFSLNITGLSPATTYYYRAYAVNPVGTSYGADSTFTTNASAVAPTVLRTAATNVQAYTATVGGNITSDGGSTVLASGIVYSTSPNPVLFGTGVVDSTTNPVVLTGIFSVNPAGLAHSTKYYYRAYATNGVGTSYSNQDSFTTAPVVSTLPYFQNFDTVVNSGWTSAPVTGTLNDWAIGTPNKTFLSAAFSAPNAMVTKLSGNYSTSHNAAITSPQLDFSAMTGNPILRFKHKFITEACCDGGLLEISINGGAWTKVENITGTGTNFNTVNGTAWYNVGAQGNSWGDNSTGYSTAANGWITSSIALPGAAGQSDVKVRFRFISDISVEDDGWAIDNIEIFAPTAPVVLTGSKTNVTTSNATLAGNITNNGGNTVSASGVVIGTSPNPTRATVGVTDSATNPLVGNGTFSVSITGLTASTTYYYRAYAVNALGTSYGSDSTFTTPASAIVPTVLKVAATNVMTTTATFGGNITSDGGAAVTSSGVVYSTNPNPVLFGFGVIDSTTTPLIASGLFSFNTEGLTHSTKYYYRAYATNSVGTSYSTQDSFTTSPIVSTLPYNQNFDGVGNTGWSSTAVGTGTNAWQLGTPAKTFLNGAYSGTNAWATRLVGNYLGTEDCAIVSPQFDFTSLVSAPVLRFRHKMDVDADPSYDGGVVEISINNGVWTRVNSSVGTGANFNTANSYAWYNDAQGFGALGANMFTDITSGYSSQTGGWIESAVPLIGAAGQSNVRIRFRFVADIFTDEGWAIDDIEIVNVTTPTTAASNVNITPNSTNANVTFTAGNGQGRMVVARLSSVLAVAPTNNTLYGASAVYGSTNTTGTGNFIVYMGTGTNVNVTGLTALTGYTFDVYEYNGKYMHNSFAGAISSNTTTTPVKLVSLKATNINEDVLISWTTASEVNNRGFDVERSFDGKTFEFVGFVKGAGNSSTSNNYTLEDANAFVKAGVNKLFYRLKQMDNDGKFEYSQVVTVVNDNDLSPGIVTYPNPFSDRLSIDIKGAKAGNAGIQVMDISGRLIMSFDKTILDGNQTLTLDGLASLSQGVYFVRVSALGLNNVTKLIKQ